MFTFRILLGYFFLFIMVCSWTAQGYVGQHLLKQYPHPFFIIYFNHSLLMINILYLIASKIWYNYAKKEKYSEKNISSNIKHCIFPSNIDENFNLKEEFKKEDNTIIFQSSITSFNKYLEYVLSSTDINYLNQQNLSLCRIIFVSFCLSVIFTSGEICWLVGIRYTSVAQASVCYNSSVAFVYLFSFFLLKEKFEILPFLAVLLSLLGVAFTAFNTMAKEILDYNTIFGDLIVGGSAAFYGLFSVLYKKYLFYDDNISITIMIFVNFLIGLGNFLIFWIPLIVIHYSNLEIFEWPSNNDWNWIIINSILGTVTNIGYFMGISLTMSPLLTNIACLFLIPFTFLFDYILLNIIIPSLAIIGAFLVVLSFLLLTFKNQIIHFYSDIINKNFSTTPNSFSIQYQNCSNDLQYCQNLKNDVLTEILDLKNS